MSLSMDISTGVVRDTGAERRPPHGSTPRTVPFPPQTWGSFVSIRRTHHRTSAPGAVAAAAALALTGALALSARDADTPSGARGPGAEASGTSVLAPGRPGEPARTLSPEEAAAAVPEDTPNAADFSYMRMMVVHHRQALVMTALAPDRAASPQVKNLAARIEAAQGPEIAAMQAWLETHRAHGEGGQAGRPGSSHPSPHTPSSHPSHPSPSPRQAHPADPAHAEPTAPEAHPQHPSHPPHPSAPASPGAHKHTPGQVSGSPGGDASGHDHGSMPGMATDAQLEELERARGAAFDRLFLQLMTTHHEGAVVMAAQVLRDGRHTAVQEMADDVIAQQTAEIHRMRAM
ncbi:MULTISPECIES: DUF305 domain-containing protein [unclassified Streptomyces]|uniref:DUF305 domain-containing protein n=1 Tax=unclassified Streptomyces TaxID=2593676 RepID=UPI0009A0AD08|nr:DUF305 domain-containing protein [Streptomyces sp. C8S0]